MSTYCKSVDKRGRTLYWRIRRNGKLKRVSKEAALKSGVVLDCVIRTPKRKTPKRKTSKRKTPKRKTPKRKTPKRKTPRRAVPKPEPKFGLGDFPQEVLELISSHGLTFEDMARLGLTSRRLERAFPPTLLKEKKRKVEKKAKKGNIYLLRIHTLDEGYYEYKAFIGVEALEWELSVGGGASKGDIARILTGEEDVFVPSGRNYGDRSYTLIRVRCDNLKGFLKGPELI